MNDTTNITVDIAERRVTMKKNKKGCFNKILIGIVLIIGFAFVKRIIEIEHAEKKEVK